MCGLVGCAGSLMKREENAFKQLLVIDSIRGLDSTGIASIKRDGEINIVKQVGDGISLLEYTPSGKVFLGSIKCLIGHNRSATTGKVSRKNAHPFELDTIIGAHNGTLTNKWKLPDANKFDTDSECLFNLIQNEGARKAIPQADGAYALTWYDKNKSTLHFLRNKERPLYYCYSIDKKSIFWASEDWMLKGILRRNDILHNDIIELEEDKMLTFKLPDINTEIDKPKQEEIKQIFPLEVKRTSYTPTNTPTSITKKDSLPSMEGFNLSTLVPKNQGFSEDGARFIEFTTYLYPSYRFRCFFHEREKAEVKRLLEVKMFSGTIKGTGKSRVSGAFYRIDRGSLKPSLTNFRAKPVTWAEFSEKKRECAWCSMGLSFHENFGVSNSKEYFCEACCNDPEVIQYVKFI